MQKENSFYLLKGAVQHYAWGGVTFLPDLLGMSNSDQQPFAEYWMGAHDQAPAHLNEASGMELNRFIAADPVSVLGGRVQKAFGRLPYLLKVLDVKDMLSIQVHPAKRYAESAFREEEANGIPVTSSRRNYKDDNHKPELMVALSDFYLLHGFISPDKMKKTLQQIPAFSFLVPEWEKGGYQSLYQRVMTMPQHEVQQRLQPLIDHLLPLYEQQALRKDDPAFWAARAYRTFCGDGVMDRGLFSIFFLNLLHLVPGQAIFQDAGVLHAYLEGQNIELMANSDNVLRGGLTNKHIDVNELMKNVSFHAVNPKVIKPSKGQSPNEKIFVTPAKDFELHQYSFALGAHERIRSETADIYILMSGSVEVMDDIQVLTLNRGGAFFSLAGSTISIHCKAPALLYRATVPIPPK